MFMFGERNKPQQMTYEIQKRLWSCYLERHTSTKNIKHHFRDLNNWQLINDPLMVPWTLNLKLLIYFFIFHVYETYHKEYCHYRAQGAGHICREKESHKSIHCTYIHCVSILYWVADEVVKTSWWPSPL